jgi:8-oxo-dGTP pyrophosphatase MutT (NUDIX family)
MVKNKRDSYFYSVGGRVHMHESMEDAVVREVHEETGVHFEVDYMGYIHENFFTLDATGEVFHELSIFYYMKPIENYNLINRSLTEEENLEWISLSDIDKYEVYPEFFKDKFLNVKHNLIHVISRR